MTEPSAKIIADSISPQGHRLTTMEVTFHRFVLAEFNTHRAFSRNSASSRAIPVKKQIQRVIDDPAIPLSFPAEQSGMQGGEELGRDIRQKAHICWMEARMSAVSHAQHLAARGVHKSVVNRLLEPFMWHTAIVSATDWQGFFDQRCSPLAQPEIRAVAEAMHKALFSSYPEKVGYDNEWDDGWHLPYIDMDEDPTFADEIVGETMKLEDAKKISAARCARVSYLTHDGKRDISVDLDLYEKLVSARPPHASPLEHVATPTMQLFVPGNFTGWRQLRHEVLS